MTKKKIERLKEKESKLVSRGYKAVDEGRDKRADRILGRAARVEDRIISLEEKDKMPMKNSAIDKLISLLREQKIESGYKKVNDDELMNPYRELINTNPKVKKAIQKLQKKK